MGAFQQNPPIPTTDGREARLVPGAIRGHPIYSGEEGYAQALPPSPLGVEPEDMGRRAPFSGHLRMTETGPMGAAVSAGLRIRR